MIFNRRMHAAVADLRLALDDRTQRLTATEAAVARLTHDVQAVREIARAAHDAVHIAADIRGLRAELYRSTEQDLPASTTFPVTPAATTQTFVQVYAVTPPRLSGINAGDGRHG